MDDINFGKPVIQAKCKTPSSCEASLESQGLPGTPLAKEEWTVKDGKAKLTGSALIQAYLLTDKITDCSGRYLQTEDPRDLIACAGH